MKPIDHSADTTASPATVYALLRDGSTWPLWSPLERFELQSPGEFEAEGPGAVRHFGTGRAHSIEEIVELVPDRRLSYVQLEGLPLRDHRADIDITPTAGGCRVRWRSTFKARVPGTGWIYRAALDRFTGRCVRGFAVYAAEHDVTVS
ncbi:SRPBCC family protein [Actinorhabdospora filicis]|uniref:SRPBCC family protein n=1 Tax=Actinorhabdospora filicis TaxID=1785913 RepID=UPI00255213C5|nr:SRPBCC family protein [Actinorhabdospora filicis]